MRPAPRSARCGLGCGRSEARVDAPPGPDRLIGGAVAKSLFHEDGMARRAARDPLEGPCLAGPTGAPRSGSLQR
ncbi:hypothetical protein SLG_02970 [Sphingobium sp. SYK-6]|nr:hypothetical protein SLG_02970 [Sphingobium sp. SYK-6]